MLLLDPCFPWLGFIVCRCAPLLFSVWLPSALWVSFSWHLPCLALLGFSPQFLLLVFRGYCRLLRPLSLSSSCVPLCCFGLSSSRLVAFCVLLALLPSLFWPGSYFSTVLGFSSSCLGFPVGLPRVFLSCTMALLSSSRLLFLGQGSLCALFFPPLYPFGDFVFFCLQWSFFLLYRFPVIFLVLPFVSPWFRPFSSPASSSFSVP